MLSCARKKNIILATAESCTGGLVISALTEISGSSDVVTQGFITYSNQAKTANLSVPEKTITNHGAVSIETACTMAKGAVKNSAATIAVSVTGIAGPHGGTAEKPVGLVHMAVFNRKNSQIIHQAHRFGNLGRNKVREASVIAALNLLLLSIDSDAP